MSRSSGGGGGAPHRDAHPPPPAGAPIQAAPGDMPKSANTPIAPPVAQPTPTWKAEAGAADKSEGSESKPAGETKPE